MGKPWLKNHRHPYTTLLAQWMSEPCSSGWTFRDSLPSEKASGLGKGKEILWLSGISCFSFLCVLWMYYYKCSHSESTSVIVMLCLIPFQGVSWKRDDGVENQHEDECWIHNTEWYIFNFWHGSFAKPETAKKHMCRSCLHKYHPTIHNSDSLSHLMSWRKSQGNSEDVGNRCKKSCLYDTNWFQFRFSTLQNRLTPCSKRWSVFIASFNAAWRPCNPTCESVSTTWWSWSKETKSKLQVDSHERNDFGG